jgi:transcriptional accessory protein Tex/SPT6
VVKPGDRVTVAIVSVDCRTRRVGLSMKEEPVDDLEPEVRARFVRAEGERPRGDSAAGGAFAEAFRRAREREAQRKK